jgi:ketosteroid isomerase-like protein
MTMASDLVASQDSPANVEIVRRAFEYEISGRGTAAEVRAILDPHVVMKPVEEGASYGVNGYRDNFEHWQGEWEDLEVTIEEIIDAGDRVVLTAHHRGRGRGSGLEIEARYYEVYTLTSGKIIRVDEYSERAHALEAAGGRE